MSDSTSASTTNASTIDSIWGDDLLGRKADATTIIRFTGSRIEERKQRGVIGSYVLNIDGAWGSGKTYFLDRLARQLDDGGFMVARVNAWEDDHAEDPLIPVVAAIENAALAKLPKNVRTRKLIDSVRKTGGKAAIILGKNIALAAAKVVAGRAVDQLEQIPIELREASKAAADGIGAAGGKLLDAHADQLLKKFDEAKSSIERFKVALKTLVDGQPKQRPIFVLIDELDRCRPTYAIELLERVKHLFNIDNVIFILATDTTQLKSAIGAIYGQSFDGNRYLLRFFDRTYKFAVPSLELFIRSLFERYQIDAKKLASPNKDHVHLTIAMMGGYGLELRDAEQCFDMLRDAVTVWGHPHPLELVYLLPLIISGQQRNTELFDQLATLESGPWLKAFSSDPRRKSIPFQRNSDHYQRPPLEPQMVSASSLLQTFLEQFRTRLSTASEGPSLEGAGGWVREQFRSEFHVRYGAGYSRTDKMLSYVFDYPELVRSASKLQFGSDSVQAA